VGVGGSGTIFLTHCNLCCVFCQNAEISQGDEGRIVSAQELAGMMLGLQRMGCHNINFRDPDPSGPPGSSGPSRSPWTMASGFPWCTTAAGTSPWRSCGCWTAWWTSTCRTSSTPMRGSPGSTPGWRAMPPSPGRPCGDAPTGGGSQAGSPGNRGRGLLVRHLVLPNGLAGTDEVVRFLAGLSRNTYLNIMDQYRPCSRRTSIRRSRGGPRGRDPGTRCGWPRAGLTRSTVLARIIHGGFGIIRAY